MHDQSRDIELLMGAEGRILFAPPRAGVPHLRGFTFESLARQRLRAAESAMGGGKHFRIRPPDKEDAFPHGVSRGMWGSCTARSQCIQYRERRPANQALGTEGRILFRANPCRSPAPQRVHF